MDCHDRTKEGRLRTTRKRTAGAPALKVSASRGEWRAKRPAWTIKWEPPAKTPDGGVLKAETGGRKTHVDQWMTNRAGEVCCAEHALAFRWPQCYPHRSLLCWKRDMMGHSRDICDILSFFFTTTCLSHSIR
jgi:hypothetical protein